MLLNTLGASLLGNILTGWRINRIREVAATERKGKGIARAGYGNKKDKGNKIDS